METSHFEPRNSSVASPNRSVSEPGFFELGYQLVKLDGTTALNEIRAYMQKECGILPTLLHERDQEQAEHLNLVKKMSDDLRDKGLFRLFADENLSLFTALFGFDLDVQSVPHLRVSRPSRESDFIGWHRDTFYGNSPFEMNVWIPIFDLDQGAGLRLLPGSHLIPESNVRVVEDSNEFRRSVTRGSVANQLGYLYSPKVDDLVAGLDESETVLLQPEVGEAVVFFGSCVHRAQNLGSITRATFDLRIKHKDSPSSTKAGYYEPLSRSVVSRAAKHFLGEI